VVLEGISWDTYQWAAAERGEGRRPRLAFDQGWLEIVSPTGRHDKSGYILALIIEFAALEWERDVVGILSTTISREDIEAGFEADQTFYIQHAELMREVDDVDMAVHPPPDLVIEVDVWNDSRRKLQLFARFGVPEVWRVVDDEVIIYHLRQGEYELVDASVAFPEFTAEPLTSLMRSGRTSRRVEWHKVVLAWAKELKAGDSR